MLVNNMPFKSHVTASFSQYFLQDIVTGVNKHVKLEEKFDVNLTF